MSWPYKPQQKAQQNRVHILTHFPLGNVTVFSNVKIPNTTYLVNILRTPSLKVGGVDTGMFCMAFHLSQPFLCTPPIPHSLQWHNECDGVSNHQRLHGLLNCLFRNGSKNISKLCVTDLCEGNSPMTGEFPARRASNAENVSIWWRHHVISLSVLIVAFVFGLHHSWFISVKLHWISSVFLLLFGPQLVELFMLWAPFAYYG